MEALVLVFVFCAFIGLCVVLTWIMGKLGWPPEDT